MALMPTEVLILKEKGNTHLKNGKHMAAIDCYDEALKRTKSQPDAILLLLNRCQARLASEHYDAALADAIAVVQMEPKKPPEKALFRVARAFYGLKFWKKALRSFQELISHYPNNQTARQEIARCEMRLREESGHYDFDAMIEEAIAKAPKSDMDRADYIGSIEVRDCAIESHGRGLFTTKDVEAGELLLCEKAFAVNFVDTSPSLEMVEGVADEEKDENDKKEQENERTWRIIERRRQLIGNALVKLHRNPSLQSAFAELYPGPDWVDEVDEESGQPLADDNFVENRITYNAFGFPLITYEYHWMQGHHPDQIPEDTASSSGVWLKASYINHSCLPMVRRSFFGDMMVFRAQQNIPANTELKFGYISGLEEYKTRQEALRKYGFDCECPVCEAEKNTSEEAMEKRYSCVKQTQGLFEAGDITDLRVYNDLIDEIESTYANPPTLEYRRALISPLTNLITGCLESDLPSEVPPLTYRLLHALGFEFTVTDTSFTVQRWGFLIDDVVVSLVDLRDAYQILNPRLVGNVEGVAKKIYLIMCGEEGSWEGLYGKGGRREREMKAKAKGGERVVELPEERLGGLTLG